MANMTHRTKGMSANKKLEGKAFANAYLQCWNATEAAIRVGYVGTCPREYGRRLLHQPDVQAYINKRLGEDAMSAKECLARLSEIARGDIGDYLSVDPDTGEVGKGFDLTRAMKENKLHLVQSIVWGKTKEIKLYSKLDALDKIARAHALFVDNLNISGPQKLNDWLSGAEDEDVDDESEEDELTDER